MHPAQGGRVSQGCPKRPVRMKPLSNIHLEEWFQLSPFPVTGTMWHVPRPCPCISSGSQHHFTVPFQKYLLYNFSSSYKTTTSQKSLRSVGCREAYLYVGRKWVINKEEEASKMLPWITALALEAGGLSLIPGTHAKVARTLYKLFKLSRDLHTLTPHALQRSYW